jgi:hypothetical protein
VDKAVRRLADDDHAVAVHNPPRQRENVQALLNAQVLEHGVEQEDVALTGRSARRGRDLLRRAVMELGVGQAAVREDVARHRDRALVDVEADMATGSSGNARLTKPTPHPYSSTVMPRSGMICSIHGIRWSEAASKRPSVSKTPRHQLGRHVAELMRLATETDRRAGEPRRA